MTGERLELFRTEPKRQPLVYGFAGFALMGFLSIPAQLIERHFAPEPVKVAPRQSDPFAPIYVKRCLAKGQDFIAHQADGGQWVVHCVGKPVRT